jgi:hypothetical protein
MSTTQSKTLLPREKLHAYTYPLTLPEGGS